MSKRTIKIRYKVSDNADQVRILQYQQNYNNVLRFTYNRIREFVEKDEKFTTKQITQLQKTMNNVFIDSHFLNSAQYEAKAMKDKGGVVFGGKHLFHDRQQLKITKEEFKIKRLVPICSIGEAVKKSNRKFSILDDRHILFKPCRSDHIILEIPKLRNNLKQDLSKLYLLQESKQIPITYKLDSDFVYLTFENNSVQECCQCDKIKDRIFAIDLNPNYVGWSVVGWKDSENYTVIDAGVISNKQLNDKENSLKGYSSDSVERLRVSNKRNFENIEISKYLINKAVHYKCQIFSLEKLDIITKDNKQGRRYNRLVNNQWNRNIMYNQIRKRCDLCGIEFIETLANYSSFEGNLIYRETGLPDMCLSSIEIGRRGYEFYHQYILEDRKPQKNIIFDTSEMAKTKILQALEALQYPGSFTSIYDLYSDLVKTRKMKYRVLLEDSKLRAVCSKKSMKSKIVLYDS